MENRELLLRELSARLPYGVMVNTPNGDGHLCSINQTMFGNEYGVNISPTRRDYFNDEEIQVKIYLRPMSSMTEEETEIFNSDFGGIENGYNSIEIKRIDWLNTHHFDYRELLQLPMSPIALPAPVGLYSDVKK